MLKLIGKKEFDVFWDQGAQLKCTACVTPLREHLDTVVLQLELEPCLAVFIRGYYLILKKGRKVTKSLRWIFLLQKVYFELLFQIKWLRCVNIFGSFLLSASYLVFALVWFFFLEHSSGCSQRGILNASSLVFFSFFLIEYFPWWTLFLLAIIKIHILSFPYLTGYMHQWSASFCCTVCGNAPQCCFISPRELIFCTFFLCSSNVFWKMWKEQVLFFLSEHIVSNIHTVCLFVCFVFFFFTNMHNVTISSVLWNWGTWTSTGFGKKFKLSTLFWPLAPREAHSDCIN